MTSTVKQKRYEVEMINGSIFKNMIKYCIPLMLTGILQLLYNFFGEKYKGKELMEKTEKKPKNALAFCAI
mgnify:CR=1 FL=1